MCGQLEKPYFSYKGPGSPFQKALKLGLSATEVLKWPFWGVWRCTGRGILAGFYDEIQIYKDNLDGMAYSIEQTVGFSGRKQRAKYTFLNWRQLGTFAESFPENIAYADFYFRIVDIWKWS